MNITLLGCGSSGGVPLIGCLCNVCASANPKNKRLRASLLVETAASRVLVDTSPDLRQQALNAGIKTVDAVIYTHAHADHTHGIDELRSFNYHRDAAIPIYADALTLEELKRRFDYVFQPVPANRNWYRASLVAHEIKPYQAFSIGDIPVLPLAQQHGSMESLGFRFGDAAYSTDVKTMPEATFEALKGVKLWIVDCLAETERPTHAHLDLALSWIKRVKPERAILTHMGHELAYEALSALLPEGVEAGFDGMVVEY